MGTDLDTFATGASTVSGHQKFPSSSYQTSILSLRRKKDLTRCLRLIEMRKGGMGEEERPNLEMQVYQNLAWQFV